MSKYKYFGEGIPPQNSLFNYYTDFSFSIPRFAGDRNKFRAFLLKIDITNPASSRNSGPCIFQPREFQ